MKSLRQRIKTALFRHPAAARALWRAFRGAEARRARLADVVGRVPSVPGPPPARQRVLICTSIAAHPTAFRVDSLLAQELAGRGHDVTMLLCDGVLEACQDCEHRWAASESDFVRHGPRRNHCPTCKIAPADRLPGVTYRFYGEFLDAGVVAPPGAGPAARDIDGWFGLRDGDIALGEHVRAGALRFLAKGTVDRSSAFEQRVVERYGRAAQQTLSVARRLAAGPRYDRVIVHHGIYVPQGLLCDVLKAVPGTLVYTWALGYRESCVLFARGDTYHKVFATEIEGWDRFDFDDAGRDWIESYLRSRGAGTNDWVSWNRGAAGLATAPEVGRFVERFGGRCFGLFTNVFWDAQLHFKDSIFDDMLDWIVRTVEWFAAHPDVGLVVRVHPAEVTGSVPSRQRVVDELAKRFPTLPGNVLVVPPEQTVSSYEIAARCGCALIYGTKMGMELAALGMPVITAGDAWVRGKGITFDPASQAEYFALLERACRERLPVNVDRAKKFAYFYFFRKMIPIESLTRGSLFAPVEVRRADDDAGLRTACEAIERGEDVVLTR